MSVRRRCLDWLQSTEFLVHLQPQPTAQSPSPADSALAIDDRSHRKRRRDVKSMPANDDAQDTEQTPRPKRPKSTVEENTEEAENLAMSLSPPSTKRLRSSVSGSTDKSTTSRKNIDVLRQMSIMKAQGDFREMRLLSEQLDSLPPDILDLISNMRLLKTGTKTVPISLKDKLSREDPFFSMGDREDLFTQVSPHDPTWREVSRIVEQALRRKEYKDFEAGWNSNVDGPLLVLACSLSPHHEHVDPANITQARPLRRLAPELPNQLQSKMVDFGLCLRDIPALDQAYRSSLLQPEDDGSKTWNHTGSASISETPLVVSIETKREGEGNTQAMLQLGSWVMKHFKRLLELRNTSIPLPSDPTACNIYLPLLKVLGPEWTFLLARGTYSEDDDGRLSLTTTIFSGSSITLGDVSTYDGFFTVLACLRYIIKWMYDEFRPWLEHWITGETKLSPSANEASLVDDSSPHR